MHRSNLDRAIAHVLDCGQELNVPNVFALYLQAVIQPSPSTQTDDAIAREALIAFDHAMDKYPMPARRPKNAPATTPIHAKDGTRRYPSEVAQLRREFQQMTLRVTAVTGDEGCTCLACGGLQAMRDQLPELQSEDEEAERSLDVPVRARRIRKTKKQSKKKTLLKRNVIPADPYAPSTSAAAL